MSRKQNDAFAGYAATINAAHVKYLRGIGADVIEAKVEGPYVFDDKGKRYIDGFCAAGIHNLGRRPQAMIDALSEAVAATDQGNFPMISREKAALAQALAEFVPGNLECSQFSVMRGECFDFACKLARGFTQKKTLVGVAGSWFGQTGFPLTLSEAPLKDKFAPLLPATKMLPWGDTDAVAREINADTAMVAVEPIQAESGARVVDADYLKALRRRCDQTGALLVFDETQSGLGRSGHRFAYEHAGVTPDVLIIGEALGGGVFPIAATIFTQRINEFMNSHPLIHLSTFGGSDIGCRVATRALSLYRETSPWDNAATMGDKLKTGIEKIAKKHKVIRSVSGAGLLLALNLGAKKRAESFCKHAANAGLLLRPGAAAGNFVLLRPSLTISAKDADDILQAIEKAAAAVG